MDIARSIYFPTSYQDSRKYFREQLESIKKIWPSARLDSHTISESEDLTIDWITADAVGSREKMILLTTGLHGVEGFVGAAMLDLFIQEYSSRLNPDTTGLLLVHVVNPWGMAHLRRVNSNNVDLNRNFLETQEDFLVEYNLDYKKLDRTLNPVHPLRLIWWENIGFIRNVIVNLVRNGIKSLRGAVLLGQQSNPAGLYYAGNDYQAETIFLKNLIKRIFSSYEAVLHLDMHTGYGPSYQMSLMNSPAETRSSQKLVKDFQYPRILSADPEGFYSMQGDMIDWVYRLKDSFYPDVKHYAAAFEFGTYGAGILKEIKSLRTMIYENQVEFYGAVSEKVKSRIRREILEMYYPSADDWREKALLDCRQGLTGILSEEGYLTRK
ncbi:MAG: M14 family metallopeptidase [Anaerolineales bacterium]|nr:M14 family metallopeptidase [Anaerolineales bacterium]